MNNRDGKTRETSDMIVNGDPQRRSRMTGGPKTWDDGVCVLLISVPLAYKVRKHSSPSKSQVTGTPSSVAREDRKSAAIVSR